jgi:hypothetical protein
MPIAPLIGPDGQRLAQRPAVEESLEPEGAAVNVSEAVDSESL